MTQTKWRVDRNIPLSLLLAIGLQTLMGVWWAASINSRVDTLEDKAAAMTTGAASATSAASSQSEKVARLEERIANVQTGINEIKAMIQPAGTMTFTPDSGPRQRQR